MAPDRLLLYVVQSRYDTAILHEALAHAKTEGLETNTDASVQVSSESPSITGSGESISLPCFLSHDAVDVPQNHFAHLPP